MRKFSLNLLFLSLLAATAAPAQQTERFDPAKDKEDFHGYVIHLTPIPGGTFGFTILKEKKAVWSQVTNPFLYGQQTGFAHKADAYKLAEWVTGQVDRNSRAPLQIKPELARQLNIADTLHRH